MSLTLKMTLANIHLAIEVEGTTKRVRACYGTYVAPKYSSFDIAKVTCGGCKQIPGFGRKVRPLRGLERLL